MSRLVDGGGYYSNGGYDAGSRDASVESRGMSRGPGGYGGMGDNTSPTRMARVDRRYGNRRSMDQRWARSRSRSRPGETTSDNTRIVEDILRYIEQQWAFMSSESCVPVKVALQLMDQSSLGLADQSDSFQRTHQQLQTALKAIVNEHHQGFNSSIGTFHQIQTSLQLSQQRVRELKASLVQAKNNLSISRPELKAFATSSQNYDQMLQVLGHIEELRAVPEKLEAQITEKSFLGAVETLLEALRLVRKPEMEEIGALSEMQVYLSNQEHSLSDILIEELHSHLYLKSPYCEQRWKTYASRDTSASTAIGTERRQLYQFLSSLSLSRPMKEDPSRNPEANSFSYMVLLLEALSRMGRLEIVVDAIEQRMPVELFKVVEKCYSEVEQRYPGNLRATGPKRATLAFAWQDDQTKKDIVEDMLLLLYARFEAIAEGHRVVHDVIAGISRRHNERDPALLRSFNGLWKLYQSEIRSLLHDHLSSAGDLGNRDRRNEDAQVNMFRPHVRDKNKRLFKLADTDKTATATATEREDLDQILKASVPGLVTQGLSSGDREDEAKDPVDRTVTGHKLLVEPSVFNMGILLPPSLAFLTRLKEIVPNNSNVVVSTLTSFLDDFLVNVFEPQMEETLAEACAAAHAQADAFQEDPRWQLQATRPVFKCTIELADLIMSFCRMLASLPPNQAFSELLIAQIRTHYNRLADFSRSISVRTPADNTAPKIKYKSASLAESEDLHDLITTLIISPGTANPDLYVQETAVLLDLVKTSPLSDADLFANAKPVRQLALLFTSSTWLAARLSGLRTLDPAASHANATSIAKHQAQSWTDSSQADPTLPLSTDTAQEFDSLLLSLNNLSSLALRTLHIELRLETLATLSRVLSSTYQLNQPYSEPDAAILGLNNALLAFDAELGARLPAAQRKACTAKLADAVDAALIALASRIPAMDEHGARRMALNILVLQQGLKEIDPSADLSRAALYWECWDGRGEMAVAEFKAGRLDKEEAKEMIRLCFSAGSDAGSREQMLGMLG